MRTVSTELNQYIASTFAKETTLMQIAKENSREIFKDGISLSAAEGALVSWLLKCHGSRKVVELGTLTGYSGLWILDALPADGHFFTFEKDEKIAGLAKQVFDQYQTHHSAKQIHLLVGDAEKNLPTINSQGPFDAVFIDANKGSYLNYLKWAEENLRSGGLVIADNTLLGGDVISGVRTGKFTEKNIEVMRNFNSYLGSQTKFQSVMIGTDEGLTVAIKQ